MQRILVTGDADSVPAAKAELPPRAGDAAAWQRAMWRDLGDEDLAIRCLRAHWAFMVETARIQKEVAQSVEARNRADR